MSRQREQAKRNGVRERALTKSGLLSPSSSMCASSRTAPSRIEKGALVARLIDTDRFVARVSASVLVEGEWLYTVVYVDDGKVEEDVPADEIERASEADAHGAPASASAPPIAVAVADREDGEAQSGKPVVHGLDEVEEGTAALVVNGDAKLGTGSGLRGIRFLRQTVDYSS